MVEDPEIAAAVVAGNPAGLAAAFDRYGTGLYAYCAVKLAEPADAAGAVQDTFAIATARLRKLRDRRELRPWLYAVARNECVRRKRARTVTLDRLTATRPDDAAADGARTAAPGGGESIFDGAKTTPGGAGTGVPGPQADLSRLAGLALAEMSPGHTEVLELELRHDLHGADLARVLGITPAQAESLASRARSQFETVLSRLLVLRAGHAVCTGLDAMLTGGDTDPAALDQHIQQCAVCTERAHLEQASAAMLALVPAAQPPPDLRAQVLSAVDATSPAGIVRRDRAARLAGPFGPGGFPVRLDARGGGMRRRRRVLAAAAAVAAVVVLTAVVLLTGNLGSRPLAASNALAGTATGASSPSASASRAAATAAKPRASARPSRRASARPSRRASARPSASPTRSTKPPSPAPSASGSPSGTPPPPAGTLAAPSTVRLFWQANHTYVGTFTLTARGGPVASYSISVTAPTVQQVTVSSPAGSLAAGSSVTETVTAAARRRGSAPEYLTLTPGGQTVTIVYG